MAEFPSTVKIGFMEYEVRRVTHIDIDGPHHVGYIDHANRVIYIKQDPDKNMELETLLHEIFHAVTNLMCMDVREEDLTRLCHGVFMALKDNGLLEK